MPNVTAQGCMTLDWIASAPQIAVPVYQREYRWSQEICHRLLDDIRAIAKAPATRTHFIGSVLVSQEDEGRLTLVDGQQRITTLMLVMAAIRDLAAVTDDTVSAEIAAILMAPDDPSRTRLQPHDRYVDVIHALMTSARTTDTETSFEQNYQFFVSEMTDDWLQIWAGLKRLEHVAIELRPDANPQQIFESLNSTGARLSDDELIHNYIHMGRSREAQERLEQDTWLPIEEATGSASREFWRDYLVATSPAQPDFAGDFGVYRAFARRYPDPLRDLTPEVGDEWKRYARRYGVLLNPDSESDPDVREQLNLVCLFEGGPRPLMLRVYDDLTAGTIDNPTFIETSERLQAMWVRRALVNLSQDIGTIGTVCRELQAGGYPLDGLITRTPEDPRVRLALAHASVPHVGYVLRRLQKPPAGVGALQIEHIHPQTPTDDWSGDDGQTRWGDLTNEQQAEFRTVLNTIGNLTLLEPPLNQGASNRSFHAKKEYYEKSDVSETKELAKRSVWNHRSITDRTRELTVQFLETWPRPSDIPMSVPEDLVRVVDLTVALGKADPEIFEYALFEGDLWGDVHNVKTLLAKVGHTLWLRDKDKFLATKHGGLIRTTRSPNTTYLDLPDGLLMYAGWHTHYLLEAIQESLTAFGLDDQVRVKMAEGD